MTVWDMDETKELIGFCYDKKQVELVYRSIYSTIDRLEYAKFHYRSAEKLFDHHVQKFNAPIDSLKAAVKDSEETNRCIWEIGVHVMACVQSLHAIADIFAHAMYYSLGHNQRPAPLNEREICLKTVKERLEQTPGHENLAKELDVLALGEGYAYLNALANHSKHRSLIRSGLWVDLTGKKLEPYTLEFQEFTYEKKPTHDKPQYLRRASLSFLQCELNRQEAWVCKAGNALNAVLREIKKQTTIVQ